MKKILCFLAVLFCITCYYSCTKDKAPKPAAIGCAGADSLNTYNLRIKGILDASCATAGCHDAVDATQGVDLSAYAVSKTSFETKNALCTIKQEGNCSLMPSGAPKLADSLITYIQCWTENGYPE